LRNLQRPRPHQLRRMLHELGKSRPWRKQRGGEEGDGGEERTHRVAILRVGRGVGLDAWLRFTVWCPQHLRTQGGLATSELAVGIEEYTAATTERFFIFVRYRHALRKVKFSCRHDFMHSAT